MPDKRIPAALIRDVWLDRSLTSTEAAAKIGLTRAHLQRRAKALGLPPRPCGHPAVIDEALLRVMWAAKVRARDIAAHFGCHVLTVTQTVRRLGLPRRPNGTHEVVALSAWLAQRYYAALARAMEHSAQQTCGALKVAKMVDRKTSKVPPIHGGGVMAVAPAAQQEILT